MLFLESTLVATLIVLLATPTSAQLTTWKEDIQEGRELEAQRNFDAAEPCYRYALENFPVAPQSPAAPMGMQFTGSGGGSIAIALSSGPSVSTCDCEDAGKCAETLNALLRVLYAQRKFTSAISVCRALVIYDQRIANGPNDPNLVAAKANYKKLIERVQSNRRWPMFAPLFNQYKFVGMDRSKVHELLGPPDSAWQMKSSGEKKGLALEIPGVHTMRESDFPPDGMPKPGHREFYVLSVLMPDPIASYGSRSENEGVFSVLDIDYVDDRVVRYRLRTRDHVGDWAHDNNAPHWPNDEAI